MNYSKKIIITSIFVLATITTLSAQTIDKQVIASAGGTLSNANHKLTFTIGEPIVGKIGSTTIINQGFLAAVSSSTTLAVDEQFLSTAIKVYPNPVQNNLQIDFTDVTGEAKIMLYSITGQLVKTKKLNAQNNTIAISNLQSGLYLVSLHFTDYKIVKTFKIIKK